MPRIKKLTAFEILDSRGRPTIWARCELGGGGVGEASVPSGASTGRAEALELRDGDPRRYRGLGCLKAVRNIQEIIADSLVGEELAEQQALDHALIALDGTPDKTRLGANATLAVSLSFARAAANASQQCLFEYLAAAIQNDTPHLPRPTINLFSGGKHAGGQVPIQDCLVVPVSARTIDEAMAMTFEVYQSAAELIAEKYGTRALTADEGGLAPPFPSVEAMFQDAVEAIRKAGLTPGEDVCIALDIASSQFFHNGRYFLDKEGINAKEMIQVLTGWQEKYPIVSIEDGLAEEDWEHWPQLRSAIGERCLVLGDDLLCTNPARIRKAIEARAANALLLKVNQIGTLTEAAEAFRLARSDGWAVTVSARSGETEDNWLADLAVGWSGDQIKVGSITQSERLAKYNRLLLIERQSGLTMRPMTGV
ncbi:MAG: phosphopyruvate hydratase [Planctomycetota bacterium]|nr:phosphopyruvate hydratase [Planctomycetota bacterium]MDA1141904.1 phosphopyruvate hydratase [Planctomycetota bacterium]